jgi:peroxiredoxin
MPAGCSAQERKREMTNQVSSPLAEGDAAPAFEFVDMNGIVYSSGEILRRGPALLTFYRGAWCACCQADLQDVVCTMAKLRETSVTVLGVFHEMSDDARARIRDDYKLDFPIVNDSEGLAAEAFGVRRTASEMAMIEDEFGPELLALKQGQPWIVPMQARFLIDTDSVIACSQVIWNYNERSDIGSLLPLLRQQI